VFNFVVIKLSIIYYWGLGIGDWGLGPIPNPQSPIPNPLQVLKVIKIFIYYYLIELLIKSLYHNIF